MRSPYLSLNENDRMLVDRRVNSEVLYLTIQALKRRMTNEQAVKVSNSIESHKRRSRNKHATDLMKSRYLMYINQKKNTMLMK